MAQITINTTPEQDTRILAAFKVILNLNRDPTIAEIKAAIIQWVRGSVQDRERRADMEQFVPQPLDPT